MDEQLSRQMGTEKGLRFRLDWLGAPSPDSTAAEASRGALVAWVGDRLVWGEPGAGAPEGVSWTWVEIVEHLAAVWQDLLWQQLPPFGFEADLRFLRATAETRWAEMPHERRDAEEVELWGFEDRHDLARGLQGIWLPPLWVLREGANMHVATPDHRIRRPVDEVLDTLEALGDAICERLARVPDERAAKAFRAWKSRMTDDKTTQVVIASGLPVEQLSLIARTEDLTEVFEVEDDPLQESELLAAARMVGDALAVEDIRATLDLLRMLPPRETPKLDVLSRRAIEALPSDDEETPPYEQGYAVAGWLREAISAGEGAAVDPEELLRDWDVTVREEELRTSLLDAVACWGRRHGPAIIINTVGKHAQDLPGRRATLAHEICHLLIDRTGALPAAEALGGRVPRDVESRARAFAAELLLPRAVAGREMARSEKSLHRLRKTFGVSAELVAWQARNSSVALPPKTHILLKGLVSEPWRF